MISFKANSPAPAENPARKAVRPTTEKILITGLENSLANFLAHGLSEQGRAVTVQAVSGDVIVAAQRNFPVIEFSFGEERFAEALARLEPDVVIHATGEPSREPSSHWPMAAFNRTVEKTLTLCEAVRRHSPRSRVMLLSSAEVYGECLSPASEQTVPAPVSIQGRYLRMAEQVLADFSDIHGLNTTVLRLATAYGPALVNNPVHDLLFTLLGPQGTHDAAGIAPNAVRDLIHAADVVQAVGLILDNSRDGVFNIGTGESVALSDLHQQLCAMLEMTPAALPVAPFPETARQHLEIAKLAALGFTPRVPLLDGLRGYAAWWSGSKAA